MTRRLALSLALSALVSCGGQGGGTSAGPTASSTPPAASGSNPCAAVAGSQGPSARALVDKSHGLGFDVRDTRELLALHGLPRPRTLSAHAAPGSAVREGNLLVLVDDGSLVVSANAFDLGGVGVRFEPNGQGGYDVLRASPAFRDRLGQRVALTDDDTREQALGFSFPFYGRSQSSAFVNSDGNLTFGAGDVAIDARSLGRVLSGAPRVAPFFADLDPSQGGAVFVDAAPDAFTATWCSVPDFDGTGRVTAQASLLPGGVVELRLDAATTLKEAIVALSPGAAAGFSTVDLSAAAASRSEAGQAVGERFAASPSLDLVLASRRALAALPDAYDQLVFWADTRVTGSDTFAFETTIRNAITGIGAEILDTSAQYGSAGRLESVLLMDDLGKYPADPSQRANGESTTLALVAHETGHRWGATLRFRDAEGMVSDAWLGRQRAHWSFFFDSDASVLEGNDIEDGGGGAFRTVGASRQYGPFDLYAMGLLEPGEVASSFYVNDPSGASQGRESAPRTGVSFTGQRREVTIASVVAALGPRNPPASASPRLHRQAWVYVVTKGASADPAAVSKLDLVRRSFEGYFQAATGGRMSLDTTLP